MKLLVVLLMSSYLSLAVEAILCRNRNVFPGKCRQHNESNFGCLEKENDVDFDDAYGLCNDENNGSFEPEDIFRTLPYAKCLNIKGKNYFLNAIRARDYWYTTKGYLLNTSLINSQIQGHSDCKDGSVLIWRPKDYNDTNVLPEGRITCGSPKSKENLLCLRSNPVNGTWGEWGPWTVIGANVGRTRSCIPPKFGGLICLGSSLDFCSTGCNTITITVVNQDTNAPITGADVTINGVPYTSPVVLNNVPTGFVLTIGASKTGFTPSGSTVTVTSVNQQATIFLTPVIPPGEIRMHLSWDNSVIRTYSSIVGLIPPSDLCESNIFTPTCAGNQFLQYYQLANNQGLEIQKLPSGSTNVYSFYAFTTSNNVLGGHPSITVYGITSTPFTFTSQKTGTDRVWLAACYDFATNTLWVADLTAEGFPFDTCYKHFYP